MKNSQLLTKSYPALLSQLKSVFIDGLKGIEQEKVRVYQLTGKLISDYILKNKVRADYATKLFDKLAKDLGIHKRTLLRAVKFYRTFPIVTARSQLSWVHYRELSYVKDEVKRKILTERAVRKGWGYRELENAIRLDRLKVEPPPEKPKSTATKLNLTRSRLFTYKILEPGYIHPIDEQLIIDLGFNFLIHTEIKGLRLKEGEIIESEKPPATKIGGPGRQYTFKRSNAAKKELHTYKALVERVVDGDTIWLNIDLGFSCWSRQKVRLRGINCPELSTKEGVEAKKFVEAKLKEVEFVVVKTYKSDKYDRYLTDIFYLPAGKAGQAQEKEAQTVLEQGIFLNQQLLDLNLARVWQ